MSFPSLCSGTCHYSKLNRLITIKSGINIMLLCRRLLLPCFSPSQMKLYTRGLWQGDYDRIMTGGLWRGDYNRCCVISCSHVWRLETSGEKCLYYWVNTDLKKMSEMHQSSVPFRCNSILIESSPFSCYHLSWYNVKAGVAGKDPAVYCQMLMTLCYSMVALETADNLIYGSPRDSRQSDIW
jgi:hypothetical protein